MDFTTVNQRVTIPAGFTQVPVIIPILDDNLQENAERFKVLIETVGELTSTGVTIGTPNQTIVEINDNDG